MAMRLKLKIYISYRSTKEKSRKNFSYYQD